MLTFLPGLDVVAGLLPLGAWVRVDTGHIVVLTGMRVVVSTVLLGGQFLTSVGHCTSV